MGENSLQTSGSNQQISKLGNLLKLTDKIITDEKVKKIKLFAKHFYSLGMNVTCISNHINEHNFFSRNILKSPNHIWKHLLMQRQTEEEMESYDWENATGIGCITGIDNLRAIDLDGCSDFSFLVNVLESLGLPPNYEWVVQSGSKNGFHIIFKAKKPKFLNENDVVTTFPPKESFRHIFEKVEILWNTNLVLPPSIHNSGQFYEFLNCDRPLNPPIQIELGKSPHRGYNEDEGTMVYIEDENGNLYYDFEFVKGVLHFINIFCDFQKIKIGQGYGDILFEFIPPNIPSNINQENILSIAKGEISCILDIETDGLPERKSENNSFSVSYPNIIQIAWILLDKKGNMLKKESELINFIGIKQTEAYNINNIDVNLVKKIGKDPIEVFKKFIADVRLSSFIVAHNADFDIPIIKSQFNKYSLPNPFSNKRIVCTMKETVHFCDIVTGNDELKFPKLFELYEKLFDYKIEQRHNAESDVLITAKCYKELINKEIIYL